MVTPQLVGTLAWSDGRHDTFLIQSDVSDVSGVPEPSSILLLLTGLAGLGLTKLRSKIV